MFRTSFSEKPSQLRPGLVAGAYPEKKQISRGLIEKLWHSSIGLCSTDRPRPHKYNEIISSIHKHCRLLEKLDEAQFAKKVTDLRGRLHKDGLTKDLTIEAFAVIREVGWKTLQMRHFDCQLMGGWIMVHGGLAEMETGEGKTLTATLAAGAAALAGIPVHIITVNDYLVERDSLTMEPLYRALGLTVAGVTSEMKNDVRRTGYQADIVYCTNKQVVFDYLRDRIVLGGDQGRRKLKLEKLYGGAHRTDRLFLRGLCFGIIDEADSVLIDEAGTPLIISKEIETPDETQTYREALKMASLLENHVDFSVNYQNRIVSLHEVARDRLTSLIGDKGGVWKSWRQTEELIRQALSACYLFQRDRHYLVQDDKVVIIDENTGRTMADRSWERGLHQLIEMKEDCKVTGQREHLARLTYQRFFSRYLCLAGMSGTVSEVRHEIWQVYGVPVEKVITNKKSKRQSGGRIYYSCKDKKWNGVIASIKDKVLAGRPVLVGTRSVADSEQLSELLSIQGIRHKVLNARQDSKEAEIISEAGIAGTVTVATNMAGRGTDIPLGPGAAELGGLHVICTELNDAVRIDRQLYGRCGRQGDPGSYEVVLSADDELLLSLVGPDSKGLLRKILRDDNWFSSHVGQFVMDYAQKNKERKNRARRRDLLQLEEQFSKDLAFSGSME